MSLRERVEKDLSFSMEDPKQWGLPVELINPIDGKIINTSLHTGEQLYGQILYDTLKTNMETGEVLYLNNPVVSLRLSSLSSFPTKADYRDWIVRIPITPSLTADKVTHKVAEAPEGGRSVGFITLFLGKVVQSS